MSGGECKVKEPPPHVILGKTQPDQDWIDGEVEVGVTVCGFPRPGPRPAGLDAPTVTSQVAAVPPPKKRRFMQRVRERFSKKAAAVPAPVSAGAVVAAPVPPAPAVPAVAPAEPPPPPPPRQDPVDALLHPRGN